MISPFSVWVLTLTAKSAVRGKLINVWRLDGTAVTTHLPEARVVLDDEEHIGRPLLRTQRFRPGR